MADRRDEQRRRMSATRLVAVQATYELDMMGVAVDDVLSEFTTDRWTGADVDAEGELARPKPEVLKELVQGVAANGAAIDAALEPAISGNRKLGELENVLRAILRMATYELMFKQSVPARTVITSYTEISDAFFDEDGPQLKLVAGIINGVARATRPDEFDEPVGVTG